MSTNTPALILPVPQPSGTNSLADVDIRQVKPPVEIPGGWAWLVWTLAAILLVLAAWWFWRRWRQKRDQAVPEVVIPPHVRARERLRAALVLLSQPEPFCVEISSALRVYLEERFQFHAPDRTTEEFLDELQTSALLSLPQKRALADFLERCDLVKFARYEPSEAELRDLYYAAVRLVEETEAAPTPPPGSQLTVFKKTKNSRGIADINS